MDGKITLTLTLGQATALTLVIAKYCDHEIFKTDDPHQVLEFIGATTALKSAISRYRGDLEAFKEYLEKTHG
jgi:ABC-type iron transport system FetAB permease component